MVAALAEGSSAVSAAVQQLAQSMPLVAAALEKALGDMQVVSKANGVLEGTARYVTATDDGEP